MKHNLWILNSSLLIIFIIIFSLNLILKKDIPVVRQRITSSTIEKKIYTPPINTQKIYEQDIFDTYATKSVEKPSLKNLVTPIPEYTPHQITPTPEPKKQEFIEPLKIKISGIISSNNKEKSITMITDETNKESIYRLGDRIKDGQIIKISKNKVILIRTNGQQETYLLREEGIPGETTPEGWKYIVKKIDNNNYIINPKEFSKKIETLGLFLEKFSMVPAYKDNKVIGMTISYKDSNDIPNIFGLNKNDIITSINNINIRDIKNRMKIYDEITNSIIGDIISINLSRNNIDQEILYKLEKIKKPKKKTFLNPTTNKESSSEEKQNFKQSKEQKREHKLKEFEKKHKTPKQQDVIQDIRKRILESMKNRSQNIRIR